jgi:hypothetical protein
VQAKENISKFSVAEVLHPALRAPYIVAGGRTSTWRLIMQPTAKLVLLAATACCWGLLMNGPSHAQALRFVYPAQHYDIYQNPDGSYESVSDLSRDIRGTPCGVTCTREAQARWSHRTQ